MATNECSRCGSNTDMFLITCRHATVCFQCGKSMAETKETCSQCGVVVTKLQKEFALKFCSDDDKKYYAAAFEKDQDLPEITNESLNKPSSDAGLLSKEPWILEDQSGIKYEGNRDGTSGSSEYFLLRKDDDDSFLLIPCAERFSFKRVRPSGTHLTTEQAEEKMEERREQTNETFKKYNKRLRTGKIKPTSTSGETVQDSLEKGEHWDHDSSCSDDEDVGDGEDIESIPVPSAIKGFQEKDNEAFLSNAGRDMKNILKKFEDSDKNDGEGSGSGASGST